MGGSSYCPTHPTCFAHFDLCICFITGQLAMGTLNPPSRKICKEVLDQYYTYFIIKSAFHHLVKIFPDCLDHFKLEGDLLRALHMTEVSQLKAMLFF